MTLTYKDGSFVLTTTYRESAVPKEAGFRWNATKKQWWTRDYARAARLSSCADIPAQAVLKAYEKTLKESRQLSRAMDADIEIPVPAGLEYRPFQKAGVAYALQRRNTLIGDDMGLGKTVEAAGVINVTEPGRILVVCPATLRPNWLRELEKWMVTRRRIGIAIGSDWPQDVEVVIINYDILKRHHDALRAVTWDLLILDEVHYLKNPKAQRTQHVFGSKTIDPIPAARILGLTGTPILNRPIEMWPILNGLDPDSWPSRYKFGIRYARGYKGPWGWDFSGASHLDELQDKLRSTIMIRRRKEDVLTELPPKQRQVIELPANGARGVIKAEQDTWAEQQARDWFGLSATCIF
ncbi:hypothetical protein LCGC14_1362040 [marine sediment metagenome]|uniref:Helicase ATP-binding domain-containing protein n=1 Tax=marine sediment metagenome TaxID=412755 RepID=A0A0F9NA00_9ZZZZ